MAQSKKARIRRGFCAEAGQTLVLFTFLAVAALGFTALVIDAGLAYAERRQAQNAVDAASLAGALELGDSGSISAAQAEAIAYLANNGYTSADADIQINIPPLSGPHQGDASFVEAIVERYKNPVFRAPISQELWKVRVRAVAGTVGSQPFPLTFASLRDDCANHTLLIKAGGTLTVEGAIYVNSCNLSKPVPPGYGDAFDIFGVGGHINAYSVHVVGGWETHDGATVSPDPLIRQQPIADPAAGVAAPDLASLTVRNGTAAAPSKLHISGTTVRTLSPGIYYGGIEITGSARVTFEDGIYYIAGGGLRSWVTQL